MKCVVIWIVAAMIATVISTSAAEHDRMQASMVLVTTDKGAGSGFVCELGGKKVVVSNAHVVECAKRIDLRLLSGAALKIVGMQVAANADLVAFQIAETNSPALRLSAAAPTLKQRITVYGNSEGAGAVTLLSGSVEGVGPEVIEVSADFVRGNSGSPIVADDGSVFGVATFVTQRVPDWVTIGTRFSEARRFGLRLTADTKWVAVTPDIFRTQTMLREDLITLAKDITGLLQLTRADDMVSRVGDKRSEWRLTVCRENGQGRVERDITLSVITQDNYHNAAVYSLIDQPLSFLATAREAAYFHVDNSRNNKLEYRSSAARMAAGQYMKSIARLASEPITLLKSTRWISTSYSADADALLIYYQELKEKLASPVASIEEMGPHMRRGKTGSRR